MGEERVALTLPQNCCMGAKPRGFRMPRSSQGLVLHHGRDRATVTICSASVGTTWKSHR